MSENSRHLVRGALKVATLLVLAAALAMAGGVLIAAGTLVAEQRGLRPGTGAHGTLESVDAVLPPWSRWSPDSAARSATHRYLILEARDGRVLASYSMTFSALEGSLLQRIFVAGANGSLPRRDAAQLLAEVKVNGTRLMFQPPEITIDSVRGVVMRFDARPLQLATSADPDQSYFVFVRFPADDDYPDVFLRPGGFRVVPLDPVPTEQGRVRAVWRHPPTNEVMFVLYRASTAAMPASGGPLLPRLLRGGERIRLPALHWLLEALCLAAPLVLYLITAAGGQAKEPEPVRGAAAVRLVLLALVLVGIVGTVENVSDLAGHVRLMGSLVDGTLTQRWVFAASSGSLAAGYAVLLLFWPALVGRWDREKRPFAGGAFSLGAPRLVSVVAAVAALAACMAAAAVFPQTHPDEPTGLATPVILGGAAVLAALAGIAAELDLLPGAWYLVPAGLLLFGLVAAHQMVVGPALVGVLLLFLLSARFMMALAKLQIVAATASPYRRQPRRVRRTTAGAVLGLAALLSWSWLERYEPPSYAAAVVSARFVTLDVQQFARLILGTVLIRTLYRASRDPRERFGPEALAAGSLLGALAFFPPSPAWFYVPVTFLAGWAVLRRLVGAPRAEVLTGAGHEAGPDPQVAREILDEIVDVKVFRRTLHAFRSQLLTKVAKGELEFPQYEEKREKLETALGRKQEALRTRAGERRPEAVLSHYTVVDPWENALLNSVWAAAFGLPWMILYLREVGGSSQASTLGFLLQSFLVVAQWPMYGFFFGYFYSRIRGWSGFAKALWFALALLVPGLVLNALSMSPAAGWRDLGLFALQVLIQSLLLGLANDIAMVRRHGFTWRTVADLHNLGAVTAWVSTLVLAIATAVATLLTTQATDLFRRALEASGSIPAASVSAPTPPGKGGASGR